MIAMCAKKRAPEGRLLALRRELIEATAEGGVCRVWFVAFGTPSTSSLTSGRTVRCEAIIRL